MEILKLEGVCKHFGGIRAIENVCISVHVGERIAIIGPNGAGKTTLFNLINGQLLPTKGVINFLSTDITKMKTYKRALMGQARSFQITSLFGELSVLENAKITFLGNHHEKYKLLKNLISLRDINEITSNVLEKIGLWEKRDEFVKNLAYGEQRKLEIGLGLSLQPSLLLLDEPGAGLAKDEMYETAEIINKLSRDITVVMVDHDMDLVFKVAERIIVLDFGEIIAEGTPEEIKVSKKVKEIYTGAEEGGASCA